MHRVFIGAPFAGTKIGNKPHNDHTGTVTKLWCMRTRKYYLAITHTHIHMRTQSLQGTRFKAACPQWNNILGARRLLGKAECHRREHAGGRPATHHTAVRRALASPGVLSGPQTSVSMEPTLPPTFHPQGENWNAGLLPGISGDWL